MTNFVLHTSLISIHGKFFALQLFSNVDNLGGLMLKNGVKMPEVKALLSVTSSPQLQQ